MEGLGELEWVTNLWEYIEEGKMPTNAEDIYSASLGYLTSEGYKKTWNKPNQYPLTVEDWDEWGGKVANYLISNGFTERNFKILVQQSLGGVFEYSYIIGSILERNNIRNQWSESQEDWDSVLDGINELPLC